jgi:hypothetical protein
MKAAQQTVQAPKTAQEQRPAPPRKKHAPHLALLQGESHAQQPDRQPGAQPANHLRAGPVPPQRESRSSGETIPTPLQARLSPLVGPRAVNEARLHTGTVAAAVAHAHDAHAVTLGADIYFAEGRYRPGTPAGDFLVAHEVAHVDQAQRGLLVGPALKAMSRAEHDALEAAADRTGDQLTPGADLEKHERPKPAPGEQKAALPAPAPAKSAAKNVAGKPPLEAMGNEIAAPGGEALPGKAASVAEAAGPQQAEGAQEALKAPKVPLMPEPSLELSKTEQKRVTGVKGRAASGAKATGTAPPAKDNVAAGQAAVQVPQQESDARAAQTVVTALAQLPPPSPEIVALCERIKKLIADKRPADEDAVVDSRPQEVADAAGSTVEGDVKKNVDDANASYGAINATPAGSQPATPPGIQPLPTEVAAPPVNAAAAVPDAVPPAQTSLDGDRETMDQQAQDAGLNKDSAKLVQSGPIAEARDTQGKMHDLSKDGPDEVQKQQKAALEQADNDMLALQAKAAASLKEARTHHVHGVKDQQGELKGGDEGLRTKLSAQADDVFTGAQTQVKELLAPVHDIAMKKWQTELPLISKRFNDDLKTTKDRISERHSGVGGFFVGAWDAVTGLPGWAGEAYDRAERNFGEDVCKLITGISQDVNFVIEQAKSIVQAARDEIHDIFTKDLPDSLKSWADEQEKGFGKKLDALQDSAEKTRSDFNKDLIENAGNAVQAAREQIQKLREEAGGLWGRFLNALNKFLDDPIRFIINGLLSLVGISPAAFWAMVAKIQKVAGDIVDAPLNFANNLMAGVGKGFSQFFDNIEKHLLQGMLEWLLSGLKNEGISVQIPKELSLKSAVSFFLELMGITWPRIRKLLVEQLGEKPVAYMEKAAGVIATLASKGISGIIDDIKHMLEPKTIVDAILDMAVKFLVETLIVKVAQRIILMLNPAGAILAAIEAIYRVLKWIFTNAARIFHLIEAVVNGMADVIAGNIGGVANTVEKALGMLVAPVIDFLSDYLGLGGLPGKVAKGLKGLQGWIEGVMRNVIAWLVATGKKLLAAVGIKVGDDKDKKKAAEGVGESVAFSGGKESHSIYVEVSGASATVMIASTPVRLAQWLDKAEKKVPDLPGQKDQNQARTLIAKARELLAATDKQADKVATEHQAAATATEPKAATADSANDEVKSDEHKLSTVLAEIADLLGMDNKPERLEARAVNISRKQESDELVKSLGAANSTTLQVGTEYDPERVTKELVGNYGAEFDPLKKLVTLRSADADAMAKTASLDEMSRSAAKRTGATSIEFAKSEGRFELSGRIGALSTKLAYGTAPDPLTDKEVETVAQARHEQLLPKWRSDVVECGYKAFIAGKDEEVWAGFDFDEPKVKAGGVAELKTYVKNEHIDTLERLRDAMTSAAVRTLFQTDRGTIAAEQAKQAGLARVTEAAVQAKIESKVKYNPNEQLGHIDTPGAGSEHAEFFPLEVSERAEGDNVITTYRTKGGTSFTVTRNASSLALVSIEGEQLSLKGAGDPKNRGVTQDSPDYVKDLSLNRAHLIADEFKGSGYADSLNLISTSAHYNQVVMRDAERLIGAFLVKLRAIRFSMKVDVSWGEVVDDKIINTIESADWFPKDYVKDANLRAAIAARLATTPDLKRCTKVSYFVEITDAELTGSVGKTFETEIGSDIWLLLLQKKK